MLADHRHGLVCSAHVCLVRVRRGHSFLSANEELLDRYAACATSAQVIAVQAAWLDALRAPPRPEPGALRPCWLTGSSRVMWNPKPNPTRFACCGSMRSLVCMRALPHPTAAAVHARRDQVTVMVWPAACIFLPRVPACEHTAHQTFNYSKPMTQHVGLRRAWGRLHGGDGPAALRVGVRLRRRGARRLAQPQPPAQARPDACTTV